MTRNGPQLIRTSKYDYIFNRRFLSFSSYGHLPVIENCTNCLVSRDHVPRRSWPLFRAKAMLVDLIAGFGSPGHQSQQEQSAA